MASQQERLDFSDGLDAVRKAVQLAVAKRQRFAVYWLNGRYVVKSFAASSKGVLCEVCRP